MSKYRRVTEVLVVEPAKRKRKCYHNANHTIEKGQLCLVVGVGIGGGQSYCRECAPAMLREGVVGLQALEKMLI